MRFDNRFCNLLSLAKKNHFAVAAFNIFNEQTMRGIIEASNRAQTPVILQVSAGTVKRLGAAALGGMVNAARGDAAYGFALHLDHCREEEVAQACIAHGWDSVMMDYSHLSMEENIRRSAEMVVYAHQNGVAVEGEVGAIVGVEEEIVTHSGSLANLEETLEYIEQTGVDAIAPAIGTAHGLYHGEPKLNFDLVKNLGQKDCPLVVHGGTGLEEDTFRTLVELGAAKINISTALKYAYRNAISDSVNSYPAESPLEFDRLVERAVTDMAEHLIRLFARKEKTDGVSL